jgi:trehalose/maltose hydrolase-like predicted phosphorylase
MASAALPGLDRRFEALVIDWDAAAPWNGDLSPLVEELCGLGLDVAFHTAAGTASVNGLLPARCPGPGRLTVHGDRPAPDAVSRILAECWARGIGPEAVLVVGPDRTRLVERILTDQLDRRRRGDPPVPSPPPDWRLDIDGSDPQFSRVYESLLALGDGRLGTRGSPLVGDGDHTPSVFHIGVYAGTGPDTELAPLPLWSRLGAEEAPGPYRRTLDLRTGVLSGEGPLTSVRFSSLARPGTVVLRAGGSAALLPPHGRHTVPGPVAAAFHDDRRGGVLDRIGVYHPDAATAEQARDAAARAGFERLLYEHREAWARRWAVADIRIDGDPELQRAVRFALFHLMASVTDEGEAAVGARGLTGPGYRGHVFWDSDVFVLPFLAATHPAAARAMLEYRYRRLPAARTVARRYGHSGARFPWESAGEGVDVTPFSARLPTGEVIRVRTGEMEEHITADVAWSAACYLDWTGDTAFAGTAGRDLIVETARYWASRVRYDADGTGHIDGVIGPDEYHEAVDDNAYTNVMARWNLRTAAELDGVPPGESASWRAAAAALVDGYQPETGLYQQFAGFFDLEPVRIAEIAPRRPIAGDLLLGLDRSPRAQVVKQADVLMLYHLVPDELAPGTLLPNLDFYEPRTSHGSSLSPAIHASLLARAGRLDEALTWLRVAARTDLEDITGSTAGGLHLATMGGLWQALVFGFAGVRVTGGRLLVDPRLPSAWHLLDVGLRYRGVPLRLRIGPDAVTVEAESLTVRRAGDLWEVVPR